MREKPESSDDVAVGVPYLINRSDGVDGHYCIAKKHPNGYHEFWNHHSQVWCSGGTLFELSKLPNTN